MAGAGEYDEVTVLGLWPSPFAIAVRVALNGKGVRHAYVEEDLVDRSELLVKSNPAYGKVPVLIHNGRPVCDSRVILQYIDEEWAATGPPILPREPYDRAVARFWAAYVHGEIDPPWRAFARAHTDEARAGAMARLISALDTLEGAFEECARGRRSPSSAATGLATSTPCSAGSCRGLVRLKRWLKAAAGSGSSTRRGRRDWPRGRSGSERPTPRGASCRVTRARWWSTSGRFRPGGPVRQETSLGCS